MNDLARDICVSLIGVGEGAAGSGGVDVDDEFGGVACGFFVDDLKTAKDEAERVGDNAGAAGGDAALRDKDDQVGEHGVDFVDRSEARSFLTEKIDGEVYGVRVGGCLSGVLAAKAEKWISGAGAATATAL